MDRKAIELLEQDHGGIAELFERVSSPEEDRPAVLRELLLRLAGHLTVEDVVVLPMVQSCDSIDGTLADDLVRNGQHIHQVLALIERRKANSPDMPDLVNDILRAFDGHVQRCQQQLYPALKRCLDEEQMESLAARLRSADHLVVESPHPHLLGNRRLARPLLAVAKLFDKVPGPRTAVGEWGGLFTPQRQLPCGRASLSGLQHCLSLGRFGFVG